MAGAYILLCSLFAFSTLSKGAPAPSPKVEPPRSIVTKSIPTPPRVAAPTRTPKNEKVQPYEDVGQSLSALTLVAQAMGVLTTLIAIVVTFATAVGFFEFRRWSTLRHEVQEYAAGVRTIRDNALAARDRLTAQFGALVTDINFTPTAEARDLADQLSQALVLLELVGVSLTCRDYLNLATDLFYKGRLQRCLQAINKAIELDPASVKAWNAKSFLLIHLKDYKEALKAAEEALKIDTRASSAWDNRGSCLLKLGYPEEALEAMLRAKELNPTENETWYNIACVYAINGDPDEAVRHLAESIRREPKNKELAREEEDFSSIKKDRRFRSLVDDAGK